MRGSWPLLAAITAVWGLVWFCTQAITDNPLGATASIAIGWVLTLLVVWGYASAMRGPRALGRLSAGSLDSGSGSDGALAIVNSTLPYLRDGLNEHTASRSARILLPLTGGSSVAIADTTGVLGTAGAANRHELATVGRRAVDTGLSIRNATEDGVEVAIPLRVEDDVVGSLVVAYDGEHKPQMGQLDSVANLLSIHLEMADLTQRAQAAADAKLDALRAQINPHFLFNTLNTIASKSRTNPDEARQLLQRLADFFRYAIDQKSQFAEFAHEYFFVRTYLSLEKARFDTRLNLHYDVEPQVLPTRVPVLTIQPLVENAVKHGLAAKAGGGTVSLRARVDPLAGAIKIQVKDDGVGMEPDVLRAVVDGTYRSDSGGVALRNIHQRLDGLYGPRYRFDIRSSPSKGTRVELELPI
jgi:two-component system LytT family sensor kinase